MARDPKIITVHTHLSLKFITIKDKKSAFRTSEPDQYYVQLIASLPRTNLVVHESIFTDKGKAQTHYDSLKDHFTAEKAVDTS